MEKNRKINKQGGGAFIWHTRVLNNSLYKAKAHLGGFSGASIMRLDHYSIAPTVVEVRPAIVITNIGSNLSRIIQYLEK